MAKTNHDVKLVQLLQKFGKTWDSVWYDWTRVEYIVESSTGEKLSLNMQGQGVTIYVQSQL